MRRLIVTFGLVLAILVPAAPASAKSFSLPEATIRVEVGRDGAVTVTEHLTYSFDGSFAGPPARYAYGAIPLPWRASPS
jgi:hypothetical protein